MSDSLHLPDRYRIQVERILRENVPHAEAWVYGSRINGESHEASDLDLVLRAPELRPIPVADMESLREAFRESNIPIINRGRERLGQTAGGVPSRNRAKLPDIPSPRPRIAYSASGLGR